MFHYGVKRDHYDKLIGIIELSERLPQDCFNNNFSPDRGNPAKNIPPLVEVDDGDAVSTCRALNFYIFISPSTAVGTISDMTLKSVSTISIGSEHMSEKKEAKLGGIYNRLTGGYCSGKFLNVNICLQRSLWFCKGFNWFN